jgi:hypothetical protein
VATESRATVHELGADGSGNGGGVKATQAAAGIQKALQESAAQPKRVRSPLFHLC